MMIVVAVMAVGAFGVRTKQQWAALEQAATYHGAREQQCLQSAAWMKRQAAGLAQQRAAGTVIFSEADPTPEDYEQSALFYQYEAANYGRIKSRLLKSWW
jgi:hypothetical protein